MTLDTIVDERKLIIDEAYLAKLQNELQNNGDYHRILKKDLTNISISGEVYLYRPTDPRLSSLFCDVRSYVCAMAIHGNYIIKPDNDYDAEKIRAILGGNVVGDLRHGYRFHRKK